MPTVGAADGSPEAESALGEVQPIAHSAADAVVGQPADVTAVYPALQNEVLDQAADRVVGQGRYHRRPQPEASAQAAGDVIFTTALPGAERPGGGDPAFPRIEPQHYLPEGGQVPPALPRFAEAEDAQGQRLRRPRPAAVTVFMTGPAGLSRRSQLPRRRAS